jgi:membrane-bound lytic murein transglycosylase D
LLARSSGLPRDSVVNVSQLLTLDRRFLTGLVGTLPPRLERSVDEGLRMVLQLQLRRRRPLARPNPVWSNNIAAAAMTPRPEPLPVRVRFSAPTGAQEFRFVNAFRIGRVDSAEVCIRDEHVSRNHAEVLFENGQWWVRDLASSNGVWAGGQRLTSVPIGQGLTIRLGMYGPEVAFEVEPPAPAPMPAPMPTRAPAGIDPNVARYVEHYFGQTPGQTAGEHTMMVRRAFVHVQAREKKKYWRIIAILGAAVLAVGGCVFYLNQKVRKQEALAQNIFYAMKSLDVDIAGVEQMVMESGSARGAEEIRKYRSRRRDMEQSYNQFLGALHTYDAGMPEQKRLVMRVARIFGECELAMPPTFVDEIESYIKKWKSTGRLAEGIRRARENGYTARIAQEMLAQDLPPQFFYLGLQESGFDPYVSGPETRKGIAKGMWQFIPETALKYGLTLGPLVDLRRADTRDDRHHWEIETKAAAHYLKDLYTTDAQASGLLVMACYNWGEGRVLPLVRGMPANPRDRNFWRLLANYRDKIPRETYDYVFYIASAAVIGENPRLFGFDFDPPLAQVEKLR